MKRAGEAGGGGPPKRGRTPRTGQFAFKVLCPEPLVAGVVGSNGATVSRIQEESGAHLTFSRRGEYFPGTRLRVLVVSAALPGDILRGLEEVLELVAGCGDEERQVLESANTLEQDDGDFVNASGDYRLRCALTASAASAALGPDGDGLSALCDETGAQIRIDEETAEGHQLATLGGDRQQLAAALERLSGLVQADVEEPWFSEWADRRSFAAAAEGPGAGGGERRRGGEGQQRGRGDAAVRPDQAGSTVFVGGLSQATQPAALRAHFERYGRVVEADVKMDSRTGRSKGFGFVAFADPRSVERCLERPSEHVVGGKWVDVKRYGDPGGEGPRPPDDLPAGAASEEEAEAGRSRRPRVRPEPPRRDERAEREEALRGHGRAPQRGGSGGGQRGERPQPGRLDLPRFVDIAHKVPPDYLGLDYCISCSLPSAQCGALIGRRGENITEVERRTGANVQLSKKDPNSDHRQLSIVGNLMSVYAAHMLLMRDFNDAAAAAQRHDDPRSDGAAQIEDLRRQIDMLRSQMGQQRRG